MFICSSYGWAATYYVDALKGSDTNNGTSSSTAWATIAKVNTASLNPGDSVLFQRGQIWRDMINVPASGTSSGYITFGAYGDVSLAKPIISGSRLIPAASWTYVGTNVYSAPWSVPSNWGTPTAVFFDDIRGNPKSSTSALAVQNDWFWDSTTSTLYVYSVNSPSALAAGVDVTAPGGSYGSIYVYGRNFIYISNLQLVRSRYSAIWLRNGSSNIVIDNCEFYQNNPAINGTPAILFYDPGSRQLSMPQIRR